MTITLDEDLVAAIDAFMMGRCYANRSEAIRDIAHSGLSQTNLEVARGPRLPCCERRADRTLQLAPQV